MEVNGQLHAPVAIGYEADWAPSRPGSSGEEKNKTCRESNTRFI
jgi:hypothetical protein